MKIKQLARNIFFKIFIGLLIVSFAFFGVSNFILNSSGSWAAKVGGKTISYAKLTNAMQSDRESILRANPQNPQALQYVESAQFRSDVLSRLVNQAIVDKLRDNFGVEASRKIILASIANDPKFNVDGKFDRNAFKAFLSDNGFDEEKYVKIMQDEIVGAIILSSIAITSPADEKLVAQIVDLKEEKRIADVVKISLNDVGSVAAPDSKTLEEYFAKNKSKFIAPEMRKISYISIAAQDLSKSLNISDQEVAAEYEKNKVNYQLPEKRNFLHVVFSDEAKADQFLQSLAKSGSGDKEKNFIKAAKDVAHKSLKEITLANTSEKTLLADIAKDAFKTPLHEVSPVLKSPLGFHVFFVSSIKSAAVAPLAEVKNAIKQELLKTKGEQFSQNKVSEIEDSLLTSASLSDVAKKFNFKTHSEIVIDASGKDAKGSLNADVKDLQNFVSNAFAATPNQVSKLFFSENNGVLYALKVDEVQKSHEKKFDEVRGEIAANYIKEKKLAELRELANKVADEIKANPSQALQIAAKHHLKVESKKSFGRFNFLEYQGRKIPYSNPLLEELFAVKVGQSTLAANVSQEELNVAILREIKKAQISPNQIAQGKAELQKDYRQEFMQAFNKFLQQKYPIKVNEKILGENKK